MANCPSCSDINLLKFDRVCHYGKSNVIRRLEVGLKYFYDWALLGIGAWNNITIDMPTSNGGNASILRGATAPGYTAGQAWEGFRENWVYESGVTYLDTTGGTNHPLIPQVYVNAILQSTGSYNINYPLGHVVFNSPISTASTVKARFSYKNINTLISDEVPWYQELQYQSWIPDSMFSKNDRGDWFVAGNHRVQLPCLVIQAVQNGVKLPYAIGGGRIWRKQDIFFHVLTDDKRVRDNLADLIVEEGDRCIQLFDIDAAIMAGNLTLDLNGRLTGSFYPSLLINYCWGTARSDNARIFSLNSYNCGLYDATIKHTYSVLFSNLC